MKIEIDKKDFGIVLKEVYSGIYLETFEGNRLGICMRDDTFEINVINPDGRSQWFRVDTENITIEELKETP